MNALKSFKMNRFQFRIIKWALKQWKKMRWRMKDDFLTNMQLVKEGKLVCKQKKCRFYHNCDNYNCSYLELAESSKEVKDE